MDLLPSLSGAWNELAGDDLAYNDLLIDVPSLHTSDTAFMGGFVAVKEEVAVQQGSTAGAAAPNGG